MSSKLIFSTLMFLALTSRAQAKMDVHEWGTFTSLVGSNGVTQNGMYHEDEALPGFVHQFGEVVNGPTVSAIGPQPQPEPQLPQPRPRPCKICDVPNEVLAQNVITQKMETPVVYFYSDKAQHVEMNVKFPQGVVTETYPGPIRTSPTNANTIANGDTTFSVNVASPKRQDGFPEVDDSNIYSHARKTNSNLVEGGNGEVEKFIFYRGLGRFQPKLQISSTQGGLTLDLENHGLELSAFLVHVDQAGRARAIQIHTKTPLYRIPAALIGQLQNKQPNRQIIEESQIHGRLVTALANEGLFNDEAEAMINTWEHGYLHVPGLRLLYVIPRAEIDQVLPLTLTPAPNSLVRVFVGRIEIMTDLKEDQVLAQVLAQKENFDVESLGRFSEAMLRRVAQLAPKEAATLFNRLIARAQNGADGGLSATVH